MTKAIRIILTALLAAAVLFPLLYTLSLSFFSPGDFTAETAKLLPSSFSLHNYALAAAHSRFPRYVLNSFITAAMASMLRLAVSTLTAFAITHIRFRGKRPIAIALASTLFIPSDAMLYENYVTTAHLGLLDSYLGIVLPSVFSASSAIILIGAYLSYDRDIYDAARIDGAGDLRYIASILTPLTDLVESWTPGRVAAQIANMHTLFNVTTTLLLLPFGNYLASLARRILPEHSSEDAGVQKLVYLKPVMKPDEYAIGTSSIIMNSVSSELKRMAEMVRTNVGESFDAVSSGTTTKLADVAEREDYIDFLNKEISRYISNMMIHETNAGDLKKINGYFRICTNLERIGDHAMNICEYTQLIEEKRIRFTPEAMKEIADMKSASLKCMDSISDISPLDLDGYTEVAALEQKIDDMTKAFRDNQIIRMRHGACDNDGAVLYTEMLTDFERIGDHMLNIAQELAAEMTETK